MENSSRKSDSGAWNTIDEALEAICSLSKVTKGTIPKSTARALSEQYGAGSSRTEPQENASALEEESNIEETSYIGGRGRLLRDYKKQYDREQLDAKIHDELKVLFGSGFSNEAIEKYHASACSSSSEPSTQETGVFSDYERDYEPEDNQPVDFVIGESKLMKKVNAAQISTPKKKSPRCRNAIILNLTQKKTSEQTEQDAKNVPVLKGPDLFLPNKSYSTVLTAAKRSSDSNQGDEPIFTAEDFPKL